MSKRRRCYRVDCKEPWVIHIKVAVGDPGAIGSKEGRFCAEHALDVRDRYTNYLRDEVVRFLKLNGVDVPESENGDAQ